MAPSTVNILLTSFAGLGLPRTLSVPTDSATPINSVLAAIHARLPPVNHPLLVTTTANKQLLSTNTEPVSALLSSPSDTFLPLRLSARLCGGKGGFGSQLRAAGGRMSSRKNRNPNQNPNASNRNLDGRRLRTVDEAKRLAEYLATKPEMDQREKDEKRKRWEAVVEAADKREEEIKAGRSGHGQGRLDADYMDGKEAAEEKTREAVMKAMRESAMEVERTGSESSAEAGGDGDSEDEAEASSGSSQEAGASSRPPVGKAFFGWDEDEDDESESESEGENGQADSAPPVYEGKGKAKAV
ncbi:hypothetical protein KC343_g1257 [Hortaea werneckii]|nr:hypothetical protein KC323_g4292 [Hortaea werneckii]KAI7200183.1 hypothetical protein KC352_g19746 [Hortaea werneckii]KAI7344861.1 hypothetical protein KC320_g8621 [Hortaea werneckii]KAI7636498.1 hypothetical protein KC343_g1257 [Hortaea werneckii]KAI7679016.1 hypothetical protein KC322_g14796 [Hortaea werneckii]